MADCFLEELDMRMNNMKLASTALIVRLWCMWLSLGTSGDLEQGNVKQLVDFEVKVEGHQIFL